MDQNNNQVQELLAIEQAIKIRLAQTIEVREKQKEQKEMFISMLENDPDYLEKEKLAKLTTKDKTGAKQRILNTPEGKTINQKIKDLQNEQKEIQEGLSYYLRELYAKTGSNQFENTDGEVLDIVYSAKLVKRSNNK